MNWVGGQQPSASVNSSVF